MAGRNNGTNIANGILCVITLLSGIIFSVLIDQLFKKMLNVLTIGTSGISSYSGYYSSPLWTIGFVYIVPGLIGAISSVTRAKCGYITQMIFSIITLLIMGVVFVVALIALGAMSLSNYSNCVSVLGSCSCGNGVSLSISLGTSCSELNSLNSMSVGLMAMIVIGWVACLIGTITGGIMACSSDVQTSGMVIQPQQGPGVTVVHTGHVQQAYPQHPGYAQPGYANPGYAQQPGYAPQGYAQQPGYDPQSQGYAMANMAYDGKGSPGNV